MNEFSLIQQLVIWVPPVLFAVTLHEVAHGWVARGLGDRTAEMSGRLSLNPLRHIDPIGTVLLPGLLFMMGGFIFGWAKPVPVIWSNLKHPRRDMALVALAGPFANLLMLLGWIGAAKLGQAMGGEMEFFSKPLIYMGFAGIIINTGLMVLNLLPLPPLDGSRVVSALLPWPLARWYGQLEPYGLLILMLLLISGLLSKLFGPALTVVEQFTRYILGV